MRKALALFALISTIIISSSDARSSIIQKPKPSPNFKINNTTNHTNAQTCSFSVKITTSCSSVSYTRDEISISFGDAYGNQVYAPRIDDPSSRAFERCSSDTYEIYGPCTYEICYLDVYRSGYDGWKLEKVDIYAYNTRRTDSFYFNVWIPANVWYGIDDCYYYRSSAAAQK
uniref:embryo-specific protein ATS3A-like n=1 Tax=Erigeron canadensis TaxID=72917 RepID=UPI001CB8DD09|nr:embryo-specific protein ATS3A-like [Erigeron canadensis]